MIHTCLFRKIGAALLVSLLLTGFFSCIERNNPWDPINGCPAVVILEARQIFGSKIDSIVAIITGYGAGIGDISGQFAAVQLTNSAVTAANAVTRDSIQRLIAYNDSVAAHNLGIADCKGTAQKRSIGFTLVQERYFSDAGYIGSIDLGYQQNELAVKKIIDTANGLCNMQAVFGKAFVDSLYERMALQRGIWLQLQAAVSGYSDLVIARNSGVDSMNALLLTMNRLMVTYNDSLAYCSLPRTADPERIKGAGDLRDPLALKSGDTLALDTGVIATDFKFTNIAADPEMPIVVIGAPAMRTVIHSPEAILSGCKYITFKNIVFSQSTQSGIKLEGSCVGIVFNHCNFINNGTYGINANQAEKITVVDCEFRGNGQKYRSSAAVATDSSCAAIRLVGGSFGANNCLIAASYGSGIYADETFLTLVKITVAANTLQGIYSKGPSVQFIIANSLITYNGLHGLFRRDEASSQTITSSNVWFYANGSGALGGDSTVISRIDYFSADPQFIDASSGNYRIGQESPLFGKDVGYQHR